MPQASEAQSLCATNQPQLSRRVGLLIELNDLKRVRAAGERYSFAANLFRRAWASLLAGETIADTVARETAHTIAAARLGCINQRVMRDGALDDRAIRIVLERSFDETTMEFGNETRERFRSRLGENLHNNLPASSSDGATNLPAFVELLVNQPRAGATRPGRGRVMLEPAENHAEHCAIVAIYAALLADIYDAEPTLPFLAGLAHHLQNAYLPDAGYAADSLIGDHLPTLTETFRRRALDQIPQNLRSTVEEALTHTHDADAPVARAFQAADVLDRVLEMRWHAQSAAFTLDVALEEMDIVHPGVTQNFHRSVMHDAGLMQ